MLTVHEADLDDHIDTPKMVLRVLHVEPRPEDWCGTNYMAGYDIDKVLAELELEEVPEDCGCGCRGTKKLAIQLDLPIGCSLASLMDNDDEYWNSIVDEVPLYYADAEIAQAADETWAMIDSVTAGWVVSDTDLAAAAQPYEEVQADTDPDIII